MPPRRDHQQRAQQPHARAGIEAREPDQAVAVERADEQRGPVGEPGMGHVVRFEQGAGVRPILGPQIAHADGHGTELGAVAPVMQSILGLT
jgi:hypothetical protein